MFRKLVSNLPFSPQLFTQLSFYGKRLSREGATRKLVVVFALMAVALGEVAAYYSTSQAPEVKQDHFLTITRVRSPSRPKVKRNWVLMSGSRAMVESRQSWAVGGTLRLAEPKASATSCSFTPATAAIAA